jgi:hypothetical protein
MGKNDLKILAVDLGIRVFAACFDGEQEFKCYSLDEFINLCISYNLVYIGRGILVPHYHSVLDSLGNKIRLISESGTTITCSHCCFNNRHVSGTVFTCKECLTKHDRDINAAKNIYKKVVGTFSSVGLDFRSDIKLTEDELIEQIRLQKPIPMTPWETRYFSKSRPNCKSVEF